MGSMWPFLLMYGSHDMRHTGFRGLTVVNGTPGIRVSQARSSWPPARASRLPATS